MKSLMHSQPSPLHGPQSHRFKRSAFTLLETLLAVFVFGMAVTGLVTAIRDMGQGALLARRESQIQNRLDSLLLETTRAPQLLEGVALDGPEKREFHEGDVSFIVTLRPLEITNLEGKEVEGLLSVTVTARWLEGNEEQEETAETWVYPRLFGQKTSSTAAPKP